MCWVSAVIEHGPTFALLRENKVVLQRIKILGSSRLEASHSLLSLSWVLAAPRALGCCSLLQRGVPVA